MRKTGKYAVIAVLWTSWKERRRARWEFLCLNVSEMSCFARETGLLKSPSRLSRLHVTVWDESDSRSGEG